MGIWKYVTKNQSEKKFIINYLLKLWTCFDIKCELKDLKNRFFKTRIQISRLKKKRVL